MFAVATFGISISADPFRQQLSDAMTLRVDLLALLGGEARVRELSPKDFKVHLARNGRAQVNWLIQLARSAELATQQTKASDRKRPLRLVAVDRIEFTEMLVDYVGGPGLARRVFTLNRLDGEAGDGEPLKLKMQGDVELSFPHTVSVTGVQSLPSITKP